ncbi:MAG TPA: decaprenyl-phosphate phosphoribosyltransferase [Anaerolineaceae bacterium]|jgi:4-hydroxybenzoate polyprenyltransferase|nr:decaprenyl-phosphate phosphoribosyltransferase [Longilinea sp.]HNR45528.1 decaprenyl-phosphate phosphoribosyltransferase [Anaerolineaceae bacterium]HNS36297.1 decaprenyl-phosphate phosphoribosyltransferase [Anaerolineaceae bacterium]HNZ12338.1 decaprenyl-phosphate phosphoribosyltransferase [Anaerolineaceae bacterium]HOD03783.1 decaprenyl-phosphate phosphoribosyltransferase [Anaerolineaceae bacterium]
MIRALIKAMRLKQWPKNGFVLAALIFDVQFLVLPSVLRSVAGMLLFCLLSSAVYLINDIFDIKADQQHPQKRLRPIASGQLPVPVAATAAILFVVITLPLAWWLSPGFGIIAAAYFLVNLAYSQWLKHIPLIDVLVIAAGFVLRVAAGVTLITVERFSPWLYVVTTLLALYLGFGKRRAELTLLLHGANAHRRVLDGYTIPLLDQLITIVSGTTIVAYSLYTFSAPNLPENHTMMLTIPFVLYGIFRYLYLIQVKEAGGAPEELLLSDRPLQATVILYGIAVMVIFALFD